MPQRRVVREPLPRFVEPMLARSGLPRHDDAWAVEVKWDGIRGQLRVDRGRWSLRSRPGRDCSESFPELAEVAAALRHHRVVLDGELVHFGGDGRPDFTALRRRLVVRSGSHACTIAAQHAPATFVAFDVLHLDGSAVRQLPYLDRRQLLGGLLEPAGPCWRVPQHWVGQIGDVAAVTRDHGLEGVVCKRLGGKYEPGRRTGAWLKHKHRRRELLTVTGWMAGEGEPDTVFVARVDQQGAMTPAGSVQLGLDAAARARLRQAVADRELPASRRRRVRPVAAGIQVVVDLHGPALGPVRDGVVRQVLVDT